MFQLFEQFAAAAYCPRNNNDPQGGMKLTCPESNNCPLVEADDVTTVHEFQKYAVSASTLSRCLRTGSDSYILAPFSRM